MDVERLRAIIRRADSVQSDPAASPLEAELAVLICDLASALLAERDSLTTAEASERLGVGHVAIRQLVRRGRLVARREGRDLRITRESVEAFAADRRPRKKSEK